MHEPVPDVIPHALRAELQRVTVLRLLPVIHRVRVPVPPAPDVPAHEARPEILRAPATRVLTRRRLRGVRGVATHRTRRVSPVRQTRRVERVRAHRGDDAADVLVEPVEADRARRQLRRVARCARLGVRLHQFDRLHEEHAARAVDERRKLSVVVVDVEGVRGVLAREAQDDRVRRRRRRRRGRRARRRLPRRLRLRVRLLSFLAGVGRRSVLTRVRGDDHAHLDHLVHERGDELTKVRYRQRRGDGEDARHLVPSLRQRGGGRGGGGGGG
mmetsp:Transcript_5410/g.19542  ORF Transcript_5410/g.19542 Transcript_5410/m.19542 type:complete len:271 (-) Transcript_5410:254-1066(-)